MKKFLTALLFTGLASVGQAAVINLTCVPNPIIIAGTSGAGEEVCDTSPLVGGTINSIFVTLNYDFLTAGDPTGASTTFLFNLPGTSVDFGAGLVIDLGNRPATNGGVFVDAGEFGLWTAGASVSIFDSFVGNTPVSGASFSKIITVDYESAIPEPASVALLGLGLLTIGGLSRRRKLSK
jgi:hypothetical protein